MMPLSDVYTTLVERRDADVEAILAAHGGDPERELTFTVRELAEHQTDDLIAVVGVLVGGGY